ncbi:MAG: cation:proton antiporter [Anaerolineales bacterium]|nr:MAG: cation:proton antiporter [Anaerolineales bacterium]
MSVFLQLAFLLSIILLAAKTAGYLSTRIGQPSVLGELIVGILLGPSLLNLFGISFIAHELSEFIRLFGEMGVLLLMFLAGLEFQFDDLRDNMRVAVFSGTMGVVGPVLLGWGTGLLFGMTHAAALFLGLTLGATSVSISAQTLMELKVLRTRVGLSLLGAAIFDDILIILLLSVFLAFLGGGGGGGLDILLIIIRMAGFIVLSVMFGMRILPWIIRRVSKLQISQGLLSVSLVTMFTYSIASEYAGGLAAITGAFIAGLMLARTPEKERIETGVHAMAYGLFVPVFFVQIGLSINLRGFPPQALLFTSALVLVAIIGKWLGAGLGAKLGGLSGRESVQLGAGMISRGEVGLIAASIGISNKLVGTNEFSAIVVMILVTTLITPPILRALFARKDVKGQEIHLEAGQGRASSEAVELEAS